MFEVRTQGRGKRVGAREGHKEGCTRERHKEVVRGRVRWKGTIKGVRVRVRGMTQGRGYVGGARKGCDGQGRVRGKGRRKGVRGKGSRKGVGVKGTREAVR